jgi:thioredoxin 1
MLEVTDSTLENALQSGKYLLMFYTEWCPRCPPIMKMLQELEETEAGKFQFIKINFDTNPQARDFFQIPGVPVVLAIKNKAILAGWGGLTERYAYLKIINEILAEGETLEEK